MTRFDILPPDQRRLVPALAPLADLGFVLYVGTAIALHLGHRVSIDFGRWSATPCVTRHRSSSTRSPCRTI